MDRQTAPAGGQNATQDSPASESGSGGSDPPRPTSEVVAAAGAPSLGDTSSDSAGAPSAASSGQGGAATSSDANVVTQTTGTITVLDTIPGEVGSVATLPDPTGTANLVSFATTAPLSLQGPRPWRRFRETMGVATKFAQGQPNSELPMLTDLSVRWVRDTVDWTLMEPVAGQYVGFPAGFKERLAYYKEHDIGLVFLLAYDNYKAYKATTTNPSGDFDIKAFGAYALQMAKQLRATGVRFVLELWNEPHNMVIRPALGGSWNGAPPAPWLDYYVRMVHEAVGRVKAFDSSIRLLTDDDMWVLHYWFLEAGLPQNLDGFAFHPYVQGVPERAAVTQTTDWMSPFVAVDADNSFTSAVRRLRERGVLKLGRKPGMWVTEWGWPAGQAMPNGTIMTEEMIASWLPRAFVLAEASATEALLWFSTQDNVDGPMGLTKNDGTKRKAYLSYKAMSSILGDFYYLGQIAGADRQSTGSQAHLFRRDDYGRIAVWSVEPAKSWLKLDGQIAAAKIFDMYGASVTPTRGTSGANWVPIGAAPLYVSYPIQTTAPVLTFAARTSATAP